MGKEEVRGRGRLCSRQSSREISSGLKPGIILGFLGKHPDFMGSCYFSALSSQKFERALIAYLNLKVGTLISV